MDLPGRQLIANYAAAVDAFDVRLAGQVWVNSPDASFIYPLGQAHSEEVKAFFTDIMGVMFSELKLTRGISGCMCIVTRRGRNKIGTLARRRRRTARMYRLTAAKRRSESPGAGARPLFGDAVTALTPRGLISARSGATRSRSLTLIDQVALGGGGGLARRRAVPFRERPWRQEPRSFPTSKKCIPSQVLDPVQRTYTPVASRGSWRAGGPAKGAGPYG